jgi:hypothetical protein
MGDAEFGSWTRLSGDLERSLDLSRDLSLELERREGIVTSYCVICVYFQCPKYFLRLSRTISIRNKKNNIRLYCLAAAVRFVTCCHQEPGVVCHHLAELALH